MADAENVLESVTRNAACAQELSDFMSYGNLELRLYDLDLVGMIRKTRTKAVLEKYCVSLFGGTVDVGVIWCDVLVTSVTSQTV